MTTTRQFLITITEHRGSKKREKLSGYLEDYLQRIEKDRGIPALDHRRLHDKITSHGVTVLDETDGRCNKLFNADNVNTYDYFSDQFFGIERPLEKVVRFLHPAAMKVAESRQVLLLLGPLDAGQSALLEHIKGALEQCDPIYVLAGCPIREAPLNLMPRSLRDASAET